MTTHKQYLGDGAYAEWDSHNRTLTLTAENGVEVLDTIVLNEDVWIALLHFSRLVGLTPPNGDQHD